MEELQTEESMVRFLNEALISCEKCHLCNTVCPICDHTQKFFKEI